MPHTESRTEALSSLAIEAHCDPLLTAEVTCTEDDTGLGRNFPEVVRGRAVGCKRRHFELNVAGYRYHKTGEAAAETI